VCTPQVAPGKVVWAIRYKYQVELTPNTTSAQQETLHESKSKGMRKKKKKTNKKKIEETRLTMLQKESTRKQVKQNLKKSLKEENTSSGCKP